MPKTRIESVDGSLDLQYEIKGQGPRLFFIGGTGSDLRHPLNVLNGPLTHLFEVLAFDQRGQGRSGRPEGAWTMAAYAEDAERLMAAVGWDEALVMGVSFGGMVAQELAIRAPSRVSRLVLGCTTAGGEGGGSYALREFFELPVRDRVREFLLQSDIRRDSDWQREHPELLAKLVTQTMIANVAGLKDWDEGTWRQLEARNGHDTWERLGEIMAPTLVCGGRHDGIAPLASLRGMAERIPNAELAVFDGSHTFMAESPQALAKIISFLQAG